MSLGLSHIGATPKSPAYAAAPAARAQGFAAPKAEETPNVSVIKPVRAADNAFQARERIREQVMAERGVDLLDLYRMGSQQRIQTEAEIAAETAERARRAQARGLATIIDLRV